MYRSAIAPTNLSSNISPSIALHLDADEHTFSAVLHLNHSTLELSRMNAILLHLPLAPVGR